MKKSLAIISIIFIVIIIICVVAINSNSKMNQGIRQQNYEYEQYLENDIYGAEVITLINKAISSNESYNVQTDEKGFYINNSKNSVQIDLVMITDEEKEETTVYKMEAISKVGIIEFIKNFNTAKFKCTKIEYHKETGKLAYIEISQQY